MSMKYQLVKSFQNQGEVNLVFTPDNNLFCFKTVP